MTDDVDADRSVDDWIALIAAASGVGDHLHAIDIAARALKEHPASLPLEYRRLLAFARAGATRRAEGQLAALERDGRLAAIADHRLQVDFAALKGRLLKDRAIGAAAPEDRTRLAALAAAAYESVYKESGSCFPAINAATLWRIAGEPERASAMAQAAIDGADAETDPYWRRATAGEAWILLGDEAAASHALGEAAAAAAGRLDAIASTRRQLNWLARTSGIGRDALAAMPVPRIIHWLADPRASAEEAAALPASIAADGSGVLAFGSVLSGADIAIAEALLKIGAELNLVLPCAPEICRSFLVGRAGAAMEARFDHVLASARNVSSVTWEGDPGEATVLQLALVQARGHALLRGASLVAPVQVLACAGRQADLHDIEPGAEDLHRVVAGWPNLSTDDPVWSRRKVRAIVFGDIHGFSTITEAQHTPFLETVVGGFADALATLDGKIEYAETAGDGIYVVISDVAAAVRACHALHCSVEPSRLAAAGLPVGLQLRLSAHVGPVFQGMDRVTNRDKFFGKEVVRTARIEPVTPPGETYVTEQFAAVLYCVAGTGFDCEYVGHQPMAKGFGECRMYSVRDAGQPPT